MDQLDAIGRTGARPGVTAGNAVGNANPLVPSARVSPPRSADRAEFSDAAQLLSRLKELPDVRNDLVERVRGEIATGTYLTDAKLRQAIDEMLEDI